MEYALGGGAVMFLGVVMAVVLSSVVFIAIVGLSLFNFLRNIKK
jgi:hypothetical protein